MTQFPHKILHLIFLLFLCAFGYILSSAQAVAMSNQDFKIANKAFDLAKKKRWDRAIDQAVKAQAPLPAKLIRWMQIIDPKEDVSFSDIAAFKAHNPDWPSQTTLQRRAEDAMRRDMPADAVLKWFVDRRPVTANGHIVLGNALKTLGRDEELRLHASKAWVSVNFGRAQQKEFYRLFKKYLKPADHIARLDRLLWEGRYHPARRMLPYVSSDWKKLAEARLALRKFRGGVDGLIAKVPSHFKNHPGLVFERMRWRRIKGRDTGARELLLSLKTPPPYPHIWWDQREVMARTAVREGYYSEAYRMIIPHGLEAGSSDFAAAEWLAGWIKLRFLHEPEGALMHFEALYNNVQYPISRARGAYWIGRAFDDMQKPNQAKKWYETARTFPTTYYGQRAGEHLNKAVTFSINNKAKPNAQEKIFFEESELVHVVRFLQRQGDRDQTRAFIYKLNTMSTTAGWRTLVAELALQSGRRDLAVFVGKRALREGHGVIEAAYPILDKKVWRSKPDIALVHSVIRQESAFYERAISRAGARGLMQLMPRTASSIAKRENYRYSRAKLTQNPKLNVWLGSEYLEELLERFNGSKILTLASYNAGPSRARQWSREFGDPLVDDRDYIIDWVEQIPFNETRNYVQRVLENYHVYSHLLHEKEQVAAVEETRENAE